VQRAREQFSSTAADKGSNKAQLALTEIQPTTVTGGIALLANIDDCHVQNFEIRVDLRER
jgi:hypothetical protein